MDSSVALRFSHADVGYVHQPNVNLRDTHTPTLAQAADLATSPFPDDPQIHTTN